MRELCGCCEGLEKLTPLDTANRPGLDALSYRVGTHATFLETMMARLTTLYLDVTEEKGTVKRIYSLHGLTTRSSDDPSIALLDAWATVADVLTFYQERIANEGYLRTATERRSILELARLVGYRLRPGVAASVFLAFDLEKGYDLLIEPGMRAQSLPGPGELPQPFETGEPLEARAAWNRLGVRMTRPQYIDSSSYYSLDKIFLEGTATNLKPNDLLLFFFHGWSAPDFRRVEAVLPQPEDDRTIVTLQQEGPAGDEEQPDVVRLDDLLDPLLVPPSRPPASSRRLDRSLKEIFSEKSDISPQLFLTMTPALRQTLYPAWVNARVTTISELRSVEALRVKAAPFGHNAPLKPVYNDKCVPVRYEEWPLAGVEEIGVSLLPPVIFEAVGTAVPLRGGGNYFDQALISYAGATRQVPLVSQEVTVGSQKVSVRFEAKGTEVMVENKARIRFFIYTLPADLKLDIFKDSDSAPLLSKLSRGDLIEDRYLPSGKYGFRVKGHGNGAAGEIKGDFEIFDGISYSFVVIAKVIGGTGDLLTGSIVMVTDESLSLVYPQPEAGIAHLRVVYAFYDPSSNPDIRVKLLQNGTTQEVAVLTSGQASPYASFKAGTYRVLTSLKEPLGSDKIVSLAEGGVYTIWIVASIDSNLASVEFKQAEERIPDIAFDFSGLQRSVTLSRDIRGIKVLIEPGDLSYYINRGQKIQESISLRKVAIEFDDGISVSDQMPALPENRDVLSLDAQYDRILPGSWVVIERPGVGAEFYSAVSVRTVSRADYGITGTVTQLKLDRDWLRSSDRDLSALREITVYAQNDPLKRAEEAIDPANHENDICGSLIELDGLYDGLKPGRWLIVSGERVIEGTSGVRASELVMLSGVAQDVQKTGAPASRMEYIIDLPDDRTHTFLTLAQGGLAYCYKRDTVSIYGNLARATHGETRSEVLGSGDGGRAFQRFPLRQSPLTYLAAATPAGAESTLQVRVDDVLWHEADSLAGLGPVDRNYVTSTDDESKTAVVFGNGLSGSRLPTGVENVRAVYRTGIGKPGNVRAGQISLLATRPLGVKGVINPLPATGGADREGRDQARRNAPLAVLALDRLVSVQDYADFARTFAGIGKARAAKLTDGRRQIVFLTIAGADDIPIDKRSDLYQNLVQALHRYGDPHQQIRVELRELLLLVISAGVRLHPDYLWDAVEPKIRAAMLDTFSFERRELGQDVLLSEVISVIQNVKGVDYVDVDVLVSIPEKEFESKIKETTEGPQGAGDPKKRRILSPEEILAWVQKRADECSEKYNGPCPRIAVNLADSKDGVFQPDQIAYLSPEVPDTLILREVKP